MLGIAILAFDLCNCNSLLCRFECESQLLRQAARCVMRSKWFPEWRHRVPGLGRIRGMSHANKA